MTPVAFSPMRYSIPVSFCLGCMLICFGQALGAIPLALSMVLHGLEAYKTRVNDDTSLALVTLTQRLNAQEAQLVATTKAQAQTQTDLVSLRNSTRPVGGWVK